MEQVSSEKTLAPVFWVKCYLCDCIYLFFFSAVLVLLPSVQFLICNDINFSGRQSFCIDSI